MSIKENKILPQVLAGVTVILVFGGLFFPLIRVTIGDESTTITSSNINEDNDLFNSDVNLDVQLYLIIALVFSLFIFVSAILPSWRDVFRYSGIISLGTAMTTYFAFDDINNYITLLEFTIGLRSTFTAGSVEKGLGYFLIGSALLSSLAFSILVTYQQYMDNRKPFF